MVSTLDQRALTAPRTVCSAGSPREAGAAARQPADGRQHRLHDRETPAQRDELASICARHSRPQMDVLRTHTAIFIFDPDQCMAPLPGAGSSNPAVPTGWVCGAIAMAGVLHSPAVRLFAPATSPWAAPGRPRIGVRHLGWPRRLDLLGGCLGVAPRLTHGILGRARWPA